MTVNELVARYVNVWNLTTEPERRKEVAAIWAPKAVQFTPENRHDDLYARVTSAFEQLVAGGEHRFEPTKMVQAHHDSLVFTVDMIATASGESVWQGLIVLLLDDQDRVRLDYQYNLT